MASSELGLRMLSSCPVPSEQGGTVRMLDTYQASGTRPYWGLFSTFCQCPLCFSSFFCLFICLSFFCLFVCLLVGGLRVERRACPCPCPGPSEEVLIGHGARWHLLCIISPFRGLFPFKVSARELTTAGSKAGLEAETGRSGQTRLPCPLPGLLFSS